MADAAQHEHHGWKPGQVGLDGVGPEVDVVAEENGRFVAVDGAPDVGQDGDVVEGGEVLGVQAHPHAQSHPDPGRPGHVLGWLPETEVGGQGERHQQVRETYAGVTHAESYRRLALGPWPWGECLMTADRPFLTVNPNNKHGSETEEGNAEVPH